MRKLLIAAALAALAGFPAAGQDADRNATIIQAAQCYKSCWLEYGRLSTEAKLKLTVHVREPMRCRWMRNALGALRGCETSCQRIFKLTGLERMPARTALLDRLAADESLYDQSNCSGSTSNIPRHTGVSLVH